METFTKTATQIVKHEGEPLIELDKVELTFRAEKYGADEQKIFVQFELEGDGFQNAEVLPKGIEVTEEHPVIAHLTQWAATIISDRLATKQRQADEAAAEATAKEEAEGTE